MKIVYILWQDKSYAGRMWHPVAKLTQDNLGSYSLNYTKGANNPRFQPFPRMLDKNRTYYSEELFSFLKNRIPPASRPEHESLFQWCNLQSSSSYLELLAVSGGEKTTDNYRIISVPEEINGLYSNTFFVSGIRYLSPAEKQEIDNFQTNQIIDFHFEDDNINDPKAVLLFEKNKPSTVGYYPRYLTDDLRALSSNDANTLIKVIKVNHDAPEQFKLLCQTIAKWPKNFKPCTQDEYTDYIK